MELYDVKAPLLRYPLNAVEISHLFRAGYLHRRIRCKPQGEAHWKTIGELFPLLEYGVAGYSLPSENSHRVWRRLALPAIAILIAVGAYIFWDRSSGSSGNVTSVSQSVDHPVDTAVVIVHSN